MTYSLFTWANGPAGATKLNATNLNLMTTGIYDAHYNAVIDADAIGEVALTVGGANESKTEDTFQVLSAVSIDSVQNPSDDSASIAAGSTAFRVNERGDVFMGSSPLYFPSTSGKSILDFLYRADTRQVVMRTVHLGELGDTPELALQRANGDYPVGGSLNEDIWGVNTDTALGIIYWRGYTTPDGETQGTPGGHFNERSAQITVRAKEDFFDDKFGARLQFNVSSLSSETGDVSEARTLLELTEYGAVGIIDGTNLTANGGWASSYGLGDLVVGNDMEVKGSVGFYGTSPQTKQTVTGSRAGNAALASLLTALATLGLVTNSSTA